MQLKVSLLTVNCFFFFFFFLFLLFLFFFFFSFFFFFFYFSFLFFLSFSQILVKFVIYLLNMYFLYLPRQWSLNWSLHPHSISLVLRSSFSLIKKKGKKDILFQHWIIKFATKLTLCSVWTQLAHWLYFYQQMPSSGTSWLGLQRYIFPQYDTYPDTVVTIWYTIRYITTKQEGYCLVSCWWAQKSVQLTGSMHAFAVSAILNITLNTAQHGFFSSVYSENRHA